jgi:hypothetical protein
MIYKLGKNTLRNLESILGAGNPKSKILIKAVKEFIHQTPIDFCIISNGGLRNSELQNKLFRNGKSKCDGYKIKSKHQLGLAIDLVPWVNGSATWQDRHTYGLAGAFLGFCKAKGYPIRSGADWNGDGNWNDGWDPCHMEIIDG